MNDSQAYPQIVSAGLPKNSDSWIELALIGFFAAFLFMLLKTRDLLLRYTAAEAAFYLRIGISANLVNVSRRLSEGRIPVYLAAGYLFLGVLTFITDAGFVAAHG